MTYEAIIRDRIKAAMARPMGGALWCTYTGRDGYKVHGIVLQEPLQSTTGVWFVFVDNFANRVKLSDIKEINP